MLTGNIGIQQQRPQVYEALTKDLTPDEKAMITSVFQEAEQKAQQEAAAANAVLMLPTNGGGDMRT